MKNLLFITWDGPQTNYIESLFLPIFEKLQNENDFKFHIIQFTWGNPGKNRRTKELCIKKSISYSSIPVFRGNALVGLLKAMFFQSRFIVDYCNENDIDIIMPRATTSASIVNHIIKRVKADYFYDADGFSQDERVDFSGWSKTGFKYKLYRYFEKQAINNSKAIICRSRAAKKILYQRSGNLIDKKIITVISNGKDAEKFNVLHKSKFKKNEGLHCIYVGSLGPQYGVIPMLLIFRKILNDKPQSIFTILTGDVEYLTEIINTKFSDLITFIVIKQVSNYEVPSYIASADVAFAIRSQKFSMKGVSPIKLGEYLLCGIPVIATSGIGDTDFILEGQECAFIIDNENKIDYDLILDWCMRVWGNYSFKEQARDVGLEFFDINKTTALYAKAIKSI